MTDPTRGRLAPTTAAALMLIGVQIGLRAWVGFGGFFSLDDYVFYTRAAEHPLLSTDFLLEPYNAHLMPGAMVWVWLTTRAAPLAFAPVVAVSLALQLAIDLAFFVLLRRLFGARPAILLPFAIFLFATLTLPGMVWWAAALNQLPQQLCTVLALLAMVRYVRTRRWYDGLLGVGAIALGLAFSEKTALAIPLVFLVTWLFLVGGPLLRGLWTTLRRYWVAWAGYVTLAVGYAVGYALAVEAPVRGGVTTGEAIELVDVVLRRSLLPGVIGGPWSWAPLGWVDSLADPHPIAQVVAGLVVGGTIALTVWLRRGAARAWWLAAFMIAGEIALLLFTRVQDTGVVNVGAEYRYLTDLGLVVALCLGLAALPVRAPVREGTPVVLRPRERAVRRLERLPIDRRTIGVAAVMGLVISSSYTLATYRERWADNPARPYVTNASADLDHVEPDTVVYDAPVPTAVVWRLLWPATLPSRLFGPTGANFESFRPGQATTQLYDLGGDGRLRRSTVTGYAAVPGPVRHCGWRLRTRAVTVPLYYEAYYWDWVVQVRYSARESGTLLLTAGETSVEVPITAGKGTAYAYVTGAVSNLRLATADPGNVVCTDDITVGLPQPAEW
jgi:hypothetical protein